LEAFKCSLLLKFKHLHVQLSLHAFVYSDVEEEEKYSFNERNDKQRHGVGLIVTLTIRPLESTIQIFLAASA